MPVLLKNDLFDELIGVDNFFVFYVLQFSRFNVEPKGV